jgi:predicted Ser/Thr protein kinase
MTAPDPLFLSFQLALTSRYSIVRELGRGGMGIVYLAHEVHLDRLVAIKLLPPDMAERPALRAGFLREARLAAKLSHPHIVPILAVDEAGGFVFFVMAYVEGQTLADRVGQRGPVSASEGVRMLREIAWALAYAHAQGVVHRDVKPDNILIEAATGRALVADFGIAAMSGDVVEAGLTGTPEFMSPEQASAGMVDARSDLYSLGATAFYAFSGRVPFAGRTATEVLSRQVTETPPSLESLGFAAPRAVISLIDRCLAKEPENRPASAELVAEHLAAAADRRRELPAALRAFVRRTGRIDGAGTLVYSTALLFGSVAMSASFSVEMGFATLAAGALAGPGMFGVLAARRLLKMGFARADLGPAFHRELENSREERAVEHAQSRTLERAAGAVARVAASFSALAVPAIVIGRWIPEIRTISAAAGPATFATSCVAIASGAVYLACVQRRSDVDTAFWGRAWTGRPGALLFGIARRLPGHQRVAGPITHRATELSLGLAATDLYEALPKATRRDLGNLPAVLRRLQGDAQRLRTRHDELNGVDALRDERDAVYVKLSQAVGALETIRLNLLRLHAGSVTVEGFTTHLELAEDVSAEVERMIAARNDVESLLEFPRVVEPTPV